MINFFYKKALLEAFISMKKKPKKQKYPKKKLYNNWTLGLVSNF